jgi:hypothetical protein
MAISIAPANADNSQLAPWVAAAKAEREGRGRSFVVLVVEIALVGIEM